ncbi:trehalose-phosphatase [Nocardioides sp. BP30]|uniref:trehalose-phosphatase n=1 Tax=Nocardioides sp. BP30 TaxID=3036374 RepID=UPI0024695B77|nr:trehalose-phosphatase [Nocardioides sp. BP30]WGL53124.1 trehalose-phosphatase [Nocardioides sp. BP30]
MDFASARAEQKYAALAALASQAVVALDFDGTLSPIVEDPAQAHIHPEAGAVLTGLAPKVKAIAVVTGRPARQVLALGGLEEVADALAATGTELLVYGQYGNEHWNSSHRAIVGPRPPVGLATFLRELPRILRRHDAADAYVEEKGLAVAVHTRRLADAQGAFERLLEPLREAAEAHDLAVEPGKQVIEVRSPGMDKGLVVDRLVDTLGAKAILFAGDDLGDVEAFEALTAWQNEGLSTLKVCSASSEESALTPLADVVVKGPDGVLDLLRQLTADAG